MSLNHEILVKMVTAMELEHERVSQSIRHAENKIYDIKQNLNALNSSIHNLKTYLNYCGNEDSNVKLKTLGQLQKDIVNGETFTVIDTKGNTHNLEYVKWIDTASAVFCIPEDRIAQVGSCIILDKSGNVVWKGSDYYTE